MGQLISTWLNAAIRGRPNRRSNTYARVNKQTGKVSVVQVRNPYRGPASEAQLSARQRFGQVSSAILKWMREGKAAGDPEYLKALCEYRSQHEIGSFLGWCVKKVADTRPGHEGMEHRAIVRQWINFD